LEGSSVGENPVRGDTTVLLHFKSEKGDSPRLRLKTTQLGPGDEYQVENILEKVPKLPQIPGSDEASPQVPA